jgi:predicted N-acetyltransferase YhbS
MKLDTGCLMVEAIALYQSVGFTQCAPYAAYPQTLMPSLIFMELQLADPAASPRGA